MGKNTVAVLDWKKCYSCGSCTLSCPKKAIKMKENPEGFFYPRVGDTCINCGICYDKCPVLNSKKNPDFQRHSFAVRLKNEKLLFKSASGGAFVAAAMEILQNDGVVFGAAFDENLYCHQTYVQNPSELDCLKRSKYVESDTGESFSEAKNMLDEGRQVLYTGTPCQIAGLKSYLDKDYPNLLTMDLICHGVPSRKLLAKYIEYQSHKMGEQIICISFRDKDVDYRCGGNFQIRTKTKTKTKTKTGSLDPYYRAFLINATFRESCYTCPFAKDPSARPGDISIGDFFEMSRIDPSFDLSKGLSLCIANTEKGFKFLCSIRNSFEVYIEVMESQYLPIKGQLLKPSPRVTRRNMIYQGIDTLSPEQYFRKFPETHAYFPLYLMVRTIASKILPENIKSIIRNILDMNT